MTQEEKPPITVQYRTSETYALRNGRDYATFTIDEQAESRHFSLAIQSSYGTFGFVWDSPGRSFKQFLAHCNRSYVLGKMVGVDQVYSAEHTVASIREELDRLVTMGDVSEVQAEAERLELDALESGELEDFWLWCGERSVFKDREPWLFQSSTGGARTREFCAMWDAFWPAFIECLKEPSVYGVVREMFSACKTRNELALALWVALKDSETTTSRVNEIYHEVLSEKGWR